jgi:hypothetical protein
MTEHHNGSAPILANKHYAEESAFQPGNLLREARRQKGLAVREVPAICVLDPDGDLVRRLRRDGRAKDTAAALFDDPALRRLFKEVKASTVIRIDTVSVDAVVSSGWDEGKRPTRSSTSRPSSKLAAMSSSRCRSSIACPMPSVG